MKQADPLARPTGMDLPLRLGLSALAYFSTQVLAFQFPDSFGLVAAIWPAAGVALAALLLSPRRQWPALLGCLFAAGMAANLTTTRPMLASVGFMVANIGETAASAWLITRLGGDHIRFARVREVLALISAVIVVNAATALIGAGTAHLDIGKEFWTFYATWWVADGLGLLLVTPLIVVWAGSWPPLASLSWGRRLEAAVMLALGSAVTWIIFGWERVPLVFDLRPYLLFGFIFWAALRYGLRGTTMLLAAVSVIAIGYTAAGLGHFPLGGADAPLRLLAVQMFLGMMGMTGLLLAAALAERRDAQLRLNESEDQYRTLFESAADAIFIHDAAGQILVVNRRAGELYGYPLAELRSLSIAQVDTPEEAVHMPARIARLMTEGSHHFATHHRRKDGTTLAVEVNARRIVWQGQSAMMSICRDVTERRQAEERLQASEQRHRNLFDQANEGLFLMTPEGHITEVNQAFAKMHGYTVEEMKNMDLQALDVIPLSDRADLLRRIQAGEVLRFEVEHYHKDGHRFPLAVTTSLINLDGQPFYLAFHQDITERRQAEAALRESHGMIVKLTSQVPGVVYQYRLYPDGRSAFPFASPGMNDIYEVTPEAVREDATPVFGRLHPDDYDRIVADIQESARTLQPFHCEFRVVLPRQGLRWRLSDASPERMADGGTLWHGIISDITERQQAEAALRESSQRLEFALEGGELGTWDWCPQTGAVVFSERWAQLLEYQLGEVEPTVDFFKQHLHPEDLPAVLERLTGHVEGRLPVYASEFRMRTKSGGWKWVSDHGKVATRDQDGRPTRVTGVITDITERKKAEEAIRQSRQAALNLMRDAVAARGQTEQMSQALRASEASYRMLFREMQNGFAHSEIICDAQGRPINSRYLAVNSAFERIFGMKAEAVVGKTILEVFPALEPSWIETFGRVALTGEPVHFEMSAAALGMTFEVSAFRPAPNQYACTFTDITERRRLAQERAALDAQVRQQQKLEAIGTLASGVAHEINNPINGAMNYAQLVLDAAVPGSRTAEFAREILHETERVAIIVRNLLRFARQDSESHSLANVTDIIEGTLSLLRTVIRRDQITFTLDVPADLPALKCRSLQIQQVLMNLMTNARDALNERYPSSDPDKVLHLAASLIQKAGRPWIRITVEDHGTGITPAVRQRMFDPFFTTKPRDRGTGLGLAISHGLVKEHHGELTVESEPGKFTRMHVDLPVDNEWKL
jgi:PAS domain S-box-containing protein